MARLSPKLVASLLAFGVLAAFAPKFAQAAAGPTFGIDDYNYAVNNPLPLINVSALSPGGNNPGICPWIATGLTNFNAGTNTTNANQNKKPDTATQKTVWNFNWGTLAQQQAVEAGLSVKNYSPWVVSAPTVIAADGANTSYGTPTNLQGNANVHDVGGAVFQMTYTPVAANPNTPTFHNVHFIQGLSAYYDTYGAYVAGNFQTRIDNPAANNTPFYDDGGASGSIDNDGGNAGADPTGFYFLDRPFKIEDETIDQDYPLPDADVQFQVVVADDNVSSATVGLVTTTTHNVTLYGGDWWGYQYFTSDTAQIPEPASLSLLGVGGLILLRRRRNK